MPQIEANLLVMTDSISLRWPRISEAGTKIGERAYTESPASQADGGLR